MNDWLVMLFLGGDNDLFQFGQELLDEATLVGSSDRVTIVAEIDPTTPDAETLRGPLFPGRRAMDPIGVTNGDPATIINFVDDSRLKYDAHHRALILWDHGNGWQNVHVFANVADATNIVQAQHAALASTSSLFIDCLRSVLDEKRDIAIIGFDACLMSMIEIAFQLRDTAQFMVASQHLVPAARGWPYESLLRAMTLQPHMGPEDVVRTMVDTFAGSFNGSDDAVTLTALRLSTEVDAAVTAIDAFSRALLNTIDQADKNNQDPSKPIDRAREEIAFARRYTQSFGNPDYVDLFSFCEQIQKRFEKKDARLNRTAELVKRALRQLVVRHTRSGAASIANANGVSIYYPDADFTDDPEIELAESYTKLDFAKPEFCRWSVFLDVIVKNNPVEDEQIVRKTMAADEVQAKLQLVKNGCTCCDCNHTEKESA